MLINALCNLYDTLEKQGKTIPQEYSSVKISYLIALTPEGKLDDIIDCRTEETIQIRGGKEKTIKTPRIFVLPKRTEKPGIESNIIEHRPTYIFGLNYDSKSETFSASDKTDKARNSHKDLKKKTTAFFNGMNDKICVAYYNFVKNWDPEKETENEKLLRLGKEFDKYYAFCLSGSPEVLLHESEEFKAKWESEYANASKEKNVVTAQCGVLGEELPIARIHDKIRGIPGGKTTGSALIGFNSSAEESYGREQSYNSNISEVAMTKYTQALNYLLATSVHKTVMDDLTVLHWAESGDERYDELMTAAMYSETLDAKETNNTIKSIVDGFREGKINVNNISDFLGDIDPSVTFYILGIKPNASRISIKFLYRQRFGKILKNILQHQEDMRICDKKSVSLGAIKRELISPNSSKKEIDSSLIAKIINSIINGYPYPDFLLQTVIRRVRVDNDTDKSHYIKLNDVRLGIIKACINRKNRSLCRKEKLTVTLDQAYDNPAYLCGRLFAILEGIQLKSANYNLNRTIRDSYFASASVNPSIIFPKLLSLSQHHMAKIENAQYQDDEISEIITKLPGGFPKYLSLEEQGVFMVGYYHQKHYTKTKIEEYKKEKENKNVID